MNAAQKALDVALADGLYPREHLKNSPIVEALLEIQAPLGQPYDLVPGALQQELRDEFTSVERVNSVQVNNMFFPLAPNLANIRLRSSDGKRLLQCGPEVVTVNVLGPYPGFEEFEKSVRLSLEAFFRVARPQRPRRLGMRYINMFHPEQVAGGGALNVEARVPSELPERRGYMMKSVHPYPAALGELAVTVAHPALAPGQTDGLLLDFDFYNESPDAKSQEIGWIFDWAKNAHHVIYQAFRACVGSATIERLRGRP